jgi:hypothetical protein
MRKQLAGFFAVVKISRPFHFFQNQANAVKPEKFLIIGAAAML